MNKEIFNLIDKKKLDVVSESIEKAHGLPNECYLNGPYTKIERKKIFEDKWVTIGVASSVPNPGDTKPFDLLGIPLIIIRDKINVRRTKRNKTRLDETQKDKTKQKIKRELIDNKTVELIHVSMTKIPKENELQNSKQVQN